MTDSENSFDEDAIEGLSDDPDGDAFDGDEFQEDGEEVDEDDPQIAIENQYYRSKDLEDEEGIPAAIKGFEEVMKMEKDLKGNYSEFSFKALKKL